ncbi:neuropeptide ff receptor 2 [Plakobranchus ocellatus]|uniref:Neuropeptide ff receptor 2 n=1 Tax=Plakobranchus ocellatus TaxID=259542 RepID=A0AAV4DPB5_9GAST|nr:neuropeptide ff receptor 2 [Plakobranchus ocellatus]
MALSEVSPSIVVQSESTMRTVDGTASSSPVSFLSTSTHQIFTSPKEPLTTSSRDTTPLFISERERREYLQGLQEQTTLVMIPAMVAILLMALVGLIGNSLVLYVYYRKFRPNATRIFICVIAVFDLVSNVLLIPGEVYDMFHLWDFDEPDLCRTRLCLNSLITMMSALVLSALAVLRYRKVCVPFGWQITIRHAKILSVIILMMCILFSAPYAIINGRQTKVTPDPRIYGSECTIDDAFVDTIWPMINSGFYLLLFLSTSTTIVVLYSLVGVKTWRHSRASSAATSAGVGSSSSDGGGGTHSTSGVASTPGRYGRGESHARNSAENSTPSVKISTSSKTAVFSKGRPQGKRRLTKSESDKNGTSVTDDANVIEYFKKEESADEFGKEQDQDDADGGVYTKRMVRSPTGSNAGVNLSMVRELTMKLRAVQKQNSREENQEEQREQRDDESPQVTMGASLHDGKRRNLPSINIEPPFCGTKQSGPKSVKFYGEASKLVDTATQDSDPSLEAHPADGGSEENDSSAGDGTRSADETQKPVSDFMRSMQWVDITYCLSEDDISKGHGQRLHAGYSPKKRSREASRDNSFLRRQSKFKEAIAETIARMRQSRKESNASDLQDPVSKNRKSLSSNKVSISEPSEAKVKIKPRRSLNRTTLMLFIISAVYIIGFLPFLALMSWKSADPESFKSLDDFQLALYNLFLRSYFLNCAANPVIYGICDITFRKECKELFRKCLCCSRGIIMSFEVELVTLAFAAATVSYRSLLTELPREQEPEFEEILVRALLTLLAAKSIFVRDSVLLKAEFLTSKSRYNTCTPACSSTGAAFI